MQRNRRAALLRHLGGTVAAPVGCDVGGMHRNGRCGEAGGRSRTGQAPSIAQTACTCGSPRLGHPRRRPARGADRACPRASREYVDFKGMGGRCDGTPTDTWSPTKHSTFVWSITCGHAQQGGDPSGRDRPLVKSTHCAAAPHWPPGDRADRDWPAARNG
jgi:hypothetical protein